MRAGVRIGLVTVIGALALVAGASPAAAAGADAAKRASCFSETRTDLGADYVYSLKVRNLGCAKGEKLVIKWQQCRKSNGGDDGSCNGVKGYSCDRKITEESSTQINAKVTCSKGSKLFKHTYGQFV